MSFEVCSGDPKADNITLGRYGLDYIVLGLFSQHVRRLGPVIRNIAGRLISPY